MLNVMACRQQEQNTLNSSPNVGDKRELQQENLVTSQTISGYLELDNKNKPELKAEIQYHKKKINTLETQLDQIEHKMNYFKK